MLQTAKYIILSFFFSCCFNQALAHSNQIALTQIISHPSLDQLRKGILDELVDQGLIHSDYREVVYQNAQGNIVIAAQIAQQFVAMDPKVIVAITTPSAQTIKKAAKNSSIPIIFGGVTDPIGAGLVPSLEHPQAFITGTIDCPSAESQLMFMKKILPQLQKIGILYNPAEMNSQKQVKALKEAAKVLSLKVEEAPAFKTADVAQATTYLLDKKVDALMLPNDNAIISAFPSIAALCKKAEIPIFTSDPESVKRGAVAALANDQYVVGRETGKMVAEILKGQDARTLPIRKIEVVTPYYNDKLLEYFGLSKPQR